MMKLLVFFAAILQLSFCQKVYDWRRDWGSKFTNEFTQVSTSDRRVLYSAVDSSISSHVPAIILHDFQHSSNKMEDGIVAIRPLLSDGNQVCFIATVDNDWTYATRKLAKRHGTTIGNNDLTSYSLKTRLPGGLDPLSVQSVADFCDVDRDHIFFLKPKDSLSSFNKKIKLQGAFTRFHIGIPEELESTVFGN